jgi:hypothetical protein
MILQRRGFLQLGAGVLLARPCLLCQKPQEKADMPLVDQVPPMLDHILLGCHSVEVGVAFVEHFTGVKAAFGGVHPGRGTQNALLSLGERRYLEIIAPDSHQNGGSSPLLAKLKELREPKLVGWAAHPRNIEALAEQLKRANIAATGPTPGSRKRPDGSVLHWQTLNLQDDVAGLLPFFIQWGEGTTHPSVDAPSGCTLLRLEVLTPDPAAFAKRTSAMSLEVPIGRVEAAQLHAVIRGPKGSLSVSS